jgi:tetratricopeptide (TPR) repeat protein
MHRGTRLVLFALGALLMPHFAAAQDQEVEMVVVNRTSEALSVFVWWEGGARVRLGELGASATRTFTTPLRDAAVWLSLDVLSQGAGRRDRPDSFVPVQRGDRIEWEVRQTSPIDLFYRRLTSFSGDVGSQEPRTSRYTAISQLRIASAQGVEDDSLRAIAYREALTTINEGLAEENDNPMSFLHLGIINTGLKDYIGADRAFDQAEALYPDYVDEDGGTGAYRFNAWLDAYNDATLRLDEQDAEGAVELFRMANMVYGHRVEAYLNLGSSLAGLGDMEGSIEAWRSAIAVIESPDGNPGDDVTRETWDTEYWILAHSNLGILFPTVGRPEEAVVVLETILERYPDNAEARSSLALALAQAGQGDDALSIFDEILAREDAAPLDYFNAGVSLYGADQMDRAALAFEKTVTRSPMYRDGVQNLAQTLNLMEAFEAQIPHSEKLVELDPFNDYAHLMLVRALVQVGREPDAVAQLEVMQALPFLINNLRLQPSDTGCSIAGEAINKALEPGTSITLRFSFYDNDGNPVGTADTEVTVTVPDVAHAFAVTFEGETQVLGYSYELVG